MKRALLGIHQKIMPFKSNIRPVLILMNITVYSAKKNYAKEHSQLPVKKTLTIFLP